MRFEMNFVFCLSVNMPIILGIQEDFCRGLNVCDPPPPKNSYVEILMPRVMVLGVGAFGR